MNDLKQVKITDFKNYTDYCNYLIKEYDRSHDKNRIIENSLLIPKDIGCNGVPWNSFTKEEFIAVKFNHWLENNKQDLEQKFQKQLTYPEFMFEFKKQIK